MSLQTKEDGKSLDKGSENPDVVLMKPLLLYKRKFLLSLRDSDSCKKLPSGFSESLTSEFQDALIRIPDRPRPQGGLPSQSFRRNEYSASPPTRSDAGNSSRGIYGKWESRSSVRSDRDSDSQSDKDSDSGRRFGPQSRRPWQAPEHDGLLGSGSFPRSSGHAPGVSAPKPQLRSNELNQLNKTNEPNQLNKTNEPDQLNKANESNQLNKTIEPYHPPRPYKAVPHSRRDTDSINDETFGSMEITSEDRAEAERRRRASFEMIRKEQHKALQEKNLEKQKGGGSVSDLCGGFMDNKEEKGFHGRNNGLEVSGGIPISSNDLEKPFASHSPASRPLIPPGFKNNTLEKSSGVKSLVHPPSSEVLKTLTGESLVHADGHLVPNTNGGFERRLPKGSRVDDGQPAGTTHPALVWNKGENVNVLDRLVPNKSSGKGDQLFQVSSHLDSDGAMGNSEIAEHNAGILNDKTASGSNKTHSTSILEKILGSTLSVDDDQSNANEAHDIKSEDKWSLNSSHSSKFSQWFSVEEAKVAADVSSSMPNDLLSLIVSGDKVNVTPDHVSIDKKEEAIPTVLTCEDLEQSILSEYTAKATHVQPAVEIWSGNGEHIKKSSTHIDDHASLHLLSMLHKSTDPDSTTVNSIDSSLTDKPKVSLENDMATMFGKPNGEENSKTLTLETLFGTAFMKELHSVGAPVSVQRGPVGSSGADLVENGIHDYGTQHRNGSEAEKNWLDFNNFPIEGSSSKGARFQLPEEENLTSVGDARDHRMLSLSSNTPINIMEKLTGDFGSENSESLHFPLGSYEKMGPGVYRDVQVQQSSPGFQHQQISPQVRPLLYNNRLEPHHMLRVGSQPKFLATEPGFNHDSHAINQQVSSNMVGPSFHNPNVRVAGFDIPSQHSMMHHQMQMAGNHPQQFPRGFQVPYNGNQVQGFPSGPRQPNTASRGMPMPVGGNPPPDAFQRLIEMELRANSKQNPHPRPPPGGHNNPPEMMRGYEVDLMGMRYR